MSGGASGDRRHRAVVDYGSFAIGRKMVRSTKSSPESRIDFGHQLFDVSRFRNHLDFVDEQALPILIESLTLSEPEEFLPVNDQARISAATTVDSYRIQRMRSPFFINRAIVRDQFQL